MVGERTVSVGAAMALEREHLLPLAKEGFDLGGEIPGSGNQRLRAGSDELVFGATGGGDGSGSEDPRNVYRGVAAGEMRGTA